MSYLTDEELEALFDAHESDRVERKSAWAGSVPSDAPKAICAFANDLANHRAPGVIFLGVTDDGRPAEGFVVDDRLLLTLANLKTDGRILPPPTMSVERRVVRGMEMAVITTLPSSSPPVTFEGRIWVRVGPRRVIASIQDERVLSEKRRHHERAFDAHAVAGCPLSALSRPLFEGEYLPRAVAPDVLEANGRTYEERLSSTGMIASVEDPTPTILGLLTVSASPRTWLPGSYVEFLRIRGTEWGGPVVDEAEIDGTIGQIFTRVDDKIRAHLAVSVDFTTGESHEIRRAPYPLSALQQIIRNALMHRTYEGTNAPVRVYWFDDRIEVWSPGGPFGAVSVANFGSPGACDYRNPGIAAALKNLGFVQRFGFGIASARAAMLENGNPQLEFVVEPTHVLATLRRAP
jgi:ATP-dependent DNA helicase RecG